MAIAQVRGLPRCCQQPARCVRGIGWGCRGSFRTLALPENHFEKGCSRMSASEDRERESPRPSVVTANPEEIPNLAFS